MQYSLLGGVDHVNDDIGGAEVVLINKPLIGALHVVVEVGLDVVDSTDHRSAPGDGGAALLVDAFFLGHLPARIVGEGAVFSGEPIKGQACR